MIKVAALTTGKNTPSTRFRIRQHIEVLKKNGIEVKEYRPWIDKDRPIPGWPLELKQWSVIPIYMGWQMTKMTALIPGLLGSYRHRITWVSRHLFPGIPSFERLIKKPIILDVDDAVWNVPPFGYWAVSSLAKRADVVITGNQYLAEWFGPYSKNIRIIPTAVDAERYVPPVEKNKVDRFIIGWIGSSSTLVFLESLEPVFAKLLNNYKDIHLLIMADRRPRFPRLPTSKWTFLPWSEEKEVACIQNMDVGIMPLFNTKMTRGKCSFKMLQYMACELPVVVTPLGMNNDVLRLDEVGFPAKTDDEWIGALTYLYSERKECIRLGRNGRKTVLKYFDRIIVADQLAEIIKIFYRSTELK